MAYHTSEPLKQVFGRNHSQQTTKAKQWLLLEFMEGISDSYEIESSGLTHYWGEESYFLQHANVFSGTRKPRLVFLCHKLRFTPL